MRPVLVLVPSTVAAVPSVQPLSLALAQGGWRVQVRSEATPLWAAADDEVVLVLHGAAAGRAGALVDEVERPGARVVAIALLDGRLPPGPLEGAGSRPVGALCTGPESARPDGAVTVTVAGVSAAQGLPARRLAGPLLQVLGRLGVEGGLA